MIRSSIQKRRNFLRKIGAGITATLLSPGTQLLANDAPHHPRLPFKGEDGPLDEKYWEMVKRQFLIAPDKMIVNAANLCPSPHFIYEKVNQYTDALARDVSFQNRAVFAKVREEALTMLAEYLGISSGEVAITRNTSESNNIIVNGIDFKPSDEVILWEQNHPTNLIAWQNRARREGFKVKVIAVPAQPNSPDDLVQAFTEAVTPNTRLIAFSHISNVSGLAMPAKEICSMARAKGIMTLVDGAQSFGFLDLDLKDIGCSFYSGSAHKWLMGPLENGVLYVDEAHQAAIWPNIIAAGWQEDHTTLDEKVAVLGQRNTPSTSAMPDIIAFHQAIGKANVEARVRQLNTYLKVQIGKHLPQAEFTTPLSEALSGGVTILRIPDQDPRKLFDQLYRDFGIAGAPTGGLRISPNIYCTLKDMDRVVEALQTIVG